MPSAVVEVEVEVEQDRAKPPPNVTTKHDSDDNVVTKHDRMACTGGIDDSSFDEVVESIRVIAEAGDQLAWLDDDGLPKDENGLEDNAGNR